jgi:hypothetical protein
MQATGHHRPIRGLKVAADRKTEWTEILRIRRQARFILKEAPSAVEVMRNRIKQLGFDAAIRWGRTHRVDIALCVAAHAMRPK